MRRSFSARGLMAAAAILAAALCACRGSESEPASDDDPGATSSTGTGGAGAAGPTTLQVRVGQFNLKEFSTQKLLDPSDAQASAAAEILARFAPDIVSINEMQFDLVGVPVVGSPGAPAETSYGTFNAPGAENIKRLADRIAAAGAEPYEHTLHALGNSGFYWEGDTLGEDWYVLRGWGEFRGRFNTAVLSRYPILTDQVRVLPTFAWEDLPDNHIDQMTTDLGFGVPPGFPLFEKALHIVPIQVGDDVLHLVLLHTVSPAFDPINPYRNYDELHGLALFLDGELPGVEPLPADAKFIVIGDLNADPEDGDGLPGAIAQILDHPSVLAVFPEGAGTKGENGARNTYLSGCGNDDGMTVADPTKKFQLQLDYLLPSATLGQPLDTFLFFPDFESDRSDFDLACTASDHRFLYLDLEI